MKKILICSTLLLLAGIMINSCVEPMVPTPNRTGNGQAKLDLSVLCMTPATKADSIAGVSTYHENTLLYVDWFVFTSNASDAKAVLHKRDTTNKENVTSAFIARTIDMEPYITAYNTKSGYVYVIANLPDTYSHVADETADNTYTGGIQYTVDGQTVTVNTLGALQVLPLTADFNKFHQTSSTDYTTAVFDPQDAFVMQSDVIAFTMPEDTQTAKAEAKLTRVAAKISVDLDVIAAIDEIEAQMVGRDTIGVKYLRTWYPKLDEMQMYLSFANDVTTLQGEPVQYNNTDFFTYNRYAWYPTETTQATVPNPQSYPITNNTYHQVEGTPFYTYPMKWAMSDDHAPFIKIIIPWTAYKEDTTMMATRYIIHNQDGQYREGVALKSVTRSKSTVDTSPEGGTKEFFYKITIPVDDLQLLSNIWYQIKLDVSILGSRSDDLSTELSGQYYIVNWSTPEDVGGGKLKQGQYLSLTSHRDTFYIYGSNSLEVPVKSSHNLVTGSGKTEITSAQQWNPRTQQWENISRGSVDVDGRSSLTFVNNLNTAMNRQLDCYLMKFDITVTNEVGLKTKFTILQYPSIFIDSKKGGNAMVDGYYGNVDNHYRSTTGSGNSSPTSGNTEGSSVSTPYAPITQYTPVQQNMTVVSISSLSYTPQYQMPRDEYTAGSTATSHDYIIADPRENAGFASSDLINYWRGTYNNGQAVAWTDGQAGAIKIGSTTTPNLIAPKLLVSSRWGRTVNWGDYTSTNTYAQDYETAKKRCATYQESGYPAGRWRLPTEAETIFLAQLQNNQKIDALFSNGGYNATANGTIIQVAGTGQNDIHYWTRHEINSMRCVYDLWYWGDDPVEGASSTYTIAP